MKEIEFWNNIEYRVKPEPKYHPFKDVEECWQEMQKHQPIGWVKSKEATKDIYFTITGLTNVIHGVILNSTGGWSFSGLFDYYTFADGTPFGIKEEEQLWHGQQQIMMMQNGFIGYSLLEERSVSKQTLNVQNFQKVVSRNLSEENYLGRMSQLNLKNNMIFYRFNEIPEDECSSIWNNNNEVIGKEKGVSVYEAHKNINGTYSPVLPFPTNEMAFNDFIKHIAYFNGNKYLVTGDLLDETGTNGEPLIKNVKILKKL